MDTKITDTNPAFLHNTSSTATFGSPKAFCAPTLGSDVEPRSCANAWEKIERSTTKRVFRSRQGVLTEDEPLPVRYLSNDGRCAIEVDRLEDDHAEETSDGLTISERAAAVLVNCVYGSKTGGIVLIDSSPLSKLDVTIQQYTPNVTCHGTSSSRAPTQASCDSALSFMPASRARVSFSRSRAAGRARLPQQFYPPLWNPQQCQIQVDIPSGSESTMASWYDVWAAGVAINTMCVQRGMSGRAINLGGVNDITVTVAK